MGVVVWWCGVGEDFGDMGILLFMKCIYFGMDGVCGLYGGLVINESFVVWFGVVVG